jgi:hypothetical protein
MENNNEFNSSFKNSEKVHKAHLTAGLEILLCKVCYMTMIEKLDPWMEMGPLSVKPIRKSYLPPIYN